MTKVKLTKKQRKQVNSFTFTLTLVSLYLDGESQRSLAKNFDTSRSNVYYHIHKLDNLEDGMVGEWIAARAKGRLE